jgi:hypothetical protein
MARPDEPSSTDNPTAREGALAKLMARMMAKPTPELRRAVELIAVQVARRLDPKANPVPKQLKELLQAIGADARSLRARLICLQWALRHQPALQGILRGRFGVLSASGPTKLLAQTARNAAWQRDRVTLSRIRAEPRAHRLCAVAVVVLHEMTRWHKPQHDDPEAKVWCVLLWRIAGGRVPRRSRDPFARWEWHLRWALGRTAVDAQLLVARSIVADGVKEAGLRALPVPEGNERNDR